MTKKKRFQVKAWIGVCDGEIPWTRKNDALFRPGMADIFKTRKAGLQVYEDVRRITITIHRGLEGTP